MRPNDVCASILVDEVYRPELLRIKSTLASIDTTTGHGISSVLINATHNSTWSNLDEFDILELYIDAEIHTNSTIGPQPSYPNYMKSARFGIVQGNVQIMHKSLSKGRVLTCLLYKFHYVSDSNEFNHFDIFSYLKIFPFYCVLAFMPMTV